MSNLRKSLQFTLALTAMLCAMVFSAAAQSSDSSSNQLSASDKTFVTKAAQGGMAEVQLGQLATQKAQSDDVKKFGQRMVDDHSKANDQLKSIASQKGITVPSGLDAKDEALKDKLANMSGAQFDHAYMQAMVKDHKEDIAEFQKEASSGRDPDVKGFASQTLPTLQDHLKMAEQTAPKTSKASTTASNQSQ